MSSSIASSSMTSGSRTALPWYAALVFLAGVFWACFEFFVRSQLGQWIDEAALRGGQAFLAADKTRAPALAFLNYMPVASALLAGGFILVALIRRRDFLRPAVAVSLLLAAVGSTQMLKHGLLMRPDLNISAASGNSFPSGHTTFAAASMAAIFIISPITHRPLVALLGWIYAAIAGASTLVLGWHRPSDVIAAYLVVAWWSMSAGLLLHHVHGRSAHAHPSESPAPSAAGRALALLALFGALAVVVSLGSALLMPHPAIGTLNAVALLFFLLVGLCLIMGTAMLTGLLVHKMFTRYGVPIRFR